MTNRMKKILAIGFAAIGIAFLADTAMAAETAVWTTLNVTGGVADNVTLNVEEELRFGDISGPTLGRQHTDLSLGFKVNDLMGVSVGYRNTSAGEHRPYVGGDFRLLSGDLEKRGEEWLRKVWVNAELNTKQLTIWQINHHGSRTSTMRESLSLLKPREAVLSLDGLHRFSFPHPEVVNRLFNHGIRQVRLDLHGDYIIKM